MPSTKKKSPASAAKKKTPATTKNKNSVKKSGKKKAVITVNDGSYLQTNNMEGVSSQISVSTVTDNAVSHQCSQEATSASTSQAILAMLQKLDASNQALSKRMDLFERQAAVSSTPLSSPTSQQSGTVNTVSQLQGRAAASATQASSALNQHLTTMKQGSADQLPMIRTQGLQSSHRSVGFPTQEARDAMAPKLDVMRSIPSISSAVSQLLAHYDDQADQEALPGKGYTVRKKSGRYNVTDNPIANPQFRWPNEGLVSNSHLKKPPYDDLSMAQWISGQINNVLLIEDPVIVRNVLTQVAMAMKDAITLPWPAVRSAWAVSMSEVEEGRLGWADSTQWALNRISNSQLAVLNSHTTTSGGQRSKICRFYNEGNCNNEGHHGIYRHFCAHCHKQGRSLMHPEIRCMSRSAGRIQDQKQTATK